MTAVTTLTGHGEPVATLGQQPQELLAVLRTSFRPVASDHELVQRTFTWAQVSKAAQVYWTDFRALISAGRVEQVNPRATPTPPAFNQVS